MHVPPALASAQAALVSARQNVVHASFTRGTVEVRDALRKTRTDVDTAAAALGDLVPTSLRACIVRQALEGVRVELDAALRIADRLEPATGLLPVGTIDPVFDVLEDATTIMFASRWG